MTKYRNLPVFLCLITLLSSTVFSAFVEGVIYDDSISPIKGALVKAEKDTSLYSQIVTNTSGAYSFSLPEGTYTITASVRLGAQELQTSILLNLSTEDTIVVDLLLMPDLGADLPDIISPTDDLDFPELVEPGSKSSGITLDTNFIVLALILMAALLLAIYYVWKRQTEGQAKHEQDTKRHSEEIKKEIDELKKIRETPPLGKFLTDEEKIYQMVQRMGEVPQKHIVTETGFSKAKVTMLLKKLEKIGKIKRTSTGREKIIKIAD